MASTDAVDTRKIAFTNTSSTEERFDNKCVGIVLSASADCHVDFDKPADTGSLFIKANVSPVYFPAEFTRITVIGNAGSGNLYIAALR